MNFLIIFYIILMLIGMVCVVYLSANVNENMTTMPAMAGIVPFSSCPNNLVLKKDGKIYLYNTRKASVPGVNPIVFNDLEEYSEFVDWQHANGIHCPVLTLENVYGTDGVPKLKIATDAIHPQNGLQQMKANAAAVIAAKQRNAMGDDLSFNPTAPVMPEDQVNSLYPSPNPMDPNWGGPEFSQKLIDEGYYKGNEVSLYVP